MPATATTPWLDRITEHPSVQDMVRTIEANQPVNARGIAGSSAILTAGALHRHTGRPILLVLPHIDDADEAFDELTNLRFNAANLPVMELMPGESSINPDLLAERIALVDRLRESDAPDIITASFAALMQGIPDEQRLKQMHRTVRPGDQLEQGEFICWLADAGYTRVEAISAAGEFAVRGGIIDIFPAGSEPARIDLFGDEVDQINAIDLDTMGSDRTLDQVLIIGASLDEVQTDIGNVAFPALMPSDSIAVLIELAELTEQGRSYFDRAANTAGIFGPPEVFKRINDSMHAVVQINQFSPTAHDIAEVTLPVEPLPTFAETAADAVRELGELAQSNDVWALCQNEGELQRLHELIDEHARGANVHLEQHYLHRGFIWNDGDRPLAMVPQHELLHRYQLRRSVRRVAAGRAVDAFIDLQPGDYVVHRDHGIARFEGLRTLQTKDDKPSEEYLTLEFAKGAKLHVAATKIDLIQKYIGAFRGARSCPRSAGRSGSGRRSRSGKRCAISPGRCCNCRRRASRCPASATPPTPPGRTSSKPSFHTRKPKISSQRSPPSSAT